MDWFFANEKFAEIYRSNSERKKVVLQFRNKVFQAFTLIFLMGCSSLNYKGPVSDHFDGQRFFNPGIRNDKSFFTFLKWQLTSDKVPWPKSAENQFQYKAFEPDSADKIYVTFINHATFLIRWKNFNILTDPIWSERASPVSFAGPKRVRPPGALFEDLPPIDLVVVTHNHYDHLDIPTLKRLKEKFNPEFRVALGDGPLLKENGISKVQEMDWHQSEMFKKEQESLELIYVPALHWSGRGLSDRFASLWGGFIFRSGERTIFYAGDTGYSKHFKEVTNKYGPFGLAMLPIGAYEPRWFMKENHMNPDDAMMAWQDIGSPPTLGMHFGTFPLTDEGLEDPVRDLQKAKEKMGQTAAPFIAPLEGQTYEY
jgi:L-ascorbate metabolism protein UlaG (beta-lactamase superfamily)